MSARKRTSAQLSSSRNPAPWLAGGLVWITLAACGGDAAQGVPASLSVSGGGAGGSAGEGSAGIASGAGAAGAQPGAGAGGNAAGTSGQAGSGAAPAAGAAGANVGGQQGAGTGGSSQGGNASGGNGPGLQLPIGGPLYHVSCLLQVGAGDPAKAIRFAGKILAISGGLRFVYLQPLKTTAASLADTVGPVLQGESESMASDGDPVSFGQVVIPGEANPISGSQLVVLDAALRLVIAGPESRPCAELDGKLIQPVQMELGDPSSVDTCLFDPVPSEDTPTPAVSKASRFVPCLAP